ncbi:MAG: hypothetical protein U1E53_22490 [Dongiaceae bacterium]
MAATGPPDLARCEAPAARWSCCDLPYFAALALILWLGFFPGIMNADSTSMLAQAVSGRYDSWHSPLLSFLWRQANGVLYGPASLALLCKIIFFPAFYLFLRRFVASPWRRMAIATAIAAVPPVTGALAAAGKDGLYVAVMMAALLAFVAALERSWLWLAFAALALAATLVRHEAPLALLPMIAAGLLARLPGRPLARLGALAVALAASAVLVPAAAAFDRFVLAAAEADPLETLEVLDLAGISLRLGENLMPGYIQALGVDFPTLGRRYRADSVTPLMWPADKRYLPVPPGPDARALRAAWIDGLARCPSCYLRHRARFVLALLGFAERPQASPLPVHLRHRSARPFRERRGDGRRLSAGAAGAPL